jgi:hypothetical protein
MESFDVAPEPVLSERSESKSRSAQDDKKFFGAANFRSGWRVKLKRFYGRGQRVD